VLVVAVIRASQLAAAARPTIPPSLSSSLVERDGAMLAITPAALNDLFQPAGDPPSAWAFSGEYLTSAGAVSPPAPTAAEVRAWARGTGLAVTDRGRLPPDVWTAYAQAHPPVVGDD